jgi:hypothetical protein
VGKTSLNIGLTGQELRADGSSYFTSSSDTALGLNRLSSDGKVLEIRKDSAIVGSIGARGGDVYLETGSVGLRMYDAGGSIIPVGDTGVSKDNSIDLGEPTIRFKDLYLSGGVYLGGTGSANKLDDYESGTWTPVHTGTGATSGVAYTTRSGTYTKVGRLVTCQAHYKLSNKGSLSGFAKITGLPFAPTGGPTFVTGALVGGNWDLDADQQPVAMQYGTNSFLYLYVQEPDTSLVQASTGHFNNDSEIIITVSYNTDS